MVIVIMGAAGAGKTTVGRALAGALGWSFHDADDLHAPESIDKMRGGIPLGDDERAPWLERVRQLIAATLLGGGDAVVACSALRASYREVLRAVPGEVRFIHLDAPAALLRQRIEGRTGHFAPPALVSSQLAALEEPDDAVVVDASRSVEALVLEIRSALSI